MGAMLSVINNKFGDLFNKIFNNKKSVIIDIILIILAVFLFSFLFSHYYYFLLVDHGRELFLPAQILDGKVPYKDITLIYFPLAYYINALVYKVLGVHLDSMIIFQTVICSIFSVVYYFLSREFLSRRVSFLLTILIISCCVFSDNDLFGYVTSYSYARSYGAMSFCACVFFLIKHAKTNKDNYMYLAALLAGLSAAFKFEYTIIALILMLFIVIWKKLKITDILKLFSAFSVFPLITLGLLFGQGVVLQNLLRMLEYSVKFSTTPAMAYFLGKIGMYPSEHNFKIFNILSNTSYLLFIVIVSFLGLKLAQKFQSSKYLILLCVFCFVLEYHYIAAGPDYYWLLLPILMTFIFIYILFSPLRKDMPFIILLFSALLLSQRVFFYMVLSSEGTYSFPLLILGLLVFIKKVAPPEISNVKIKSLIVFLLIIMIGLYSKLLVIKGQPMEPIVTKRGTFYAINEHKILYSQLIEYINKNVGENETLLVLPEGNFLNFVTGRGVDLHCFMMDRLYHDAYGDYGAKNKIAGANSDYIILHKGLEGDTFGKPYLYDRYASPSARYIRENYKKEKTIINNSYQLIILKRKN